MVSSLAKESVCGAFPGHDRFPDRRSQQGQPEETPDVRHVHAQGRDITDADRIASRDLRRPGKQDTGNVL